MTPSSSYGYTAGAPYRLNGVLGSLTLGGYDSSRFTPNNVTFYITNGTYRTPIVNISSITAGGRGGEEGGSAGSAEGIALYETSFTSSIDVATGQIWLPLDACMAFERAFGLEYDPVTELYPVNDTTHNFLSSQNTSVTFNLNAWPTGDGPVPITLPYSAFDLNATYPFVANATRYFPLKRAANSSQFTLGRAFFQEAYLIVDHERNTFSVSQCTFNSGSTQTLLAIEIPSNSTNSSSTTSSASASSSSSSSGGGGGLSGGAIAGIVIGSLVGAAAFAAALLFCLRWQRNLNRSLKNDATAVPPPGPMSEHGVHQGSMPASPPMAQEHQGFYGPIAQQQNTKAAPDGAGLGVTGISDTMGNVTPGMARIVSPELVGDSPASPRSGDEQKMSELRGDRRFPRELEGEEAGEGKRVELPGDEGVELPVESEAFQELE